MVSIKPLTGLRPPPDLAGAIAAVPYDVVDRCSARQLAEGNPLSFLRITRSEIELDDEVDPYSSAVYELAARNLRAFVKAGWLIEDREPALYIYRLERGEQQQTGVMGGVHVDDYNAGRIKVHEQTRRDKETDRMEHILRLRAHTEPVFLAFQSDGAIEGEIAHATEADPLYHFTAVDGIRHTLWKVPAPGSITRFLSELPSLYIADGHHRAASASRVTQELRPKEGDTGHESFLAVLFPHTELKILPYNRIIKRLPRDAPLILAQLAESFTVTPGAPPVPQQKGTFSLYIDRQWYGLVPRNLLPATDPVAALDVSILSDLALKPIFHIFDQRTDDNIDFVGGIHGTTVLEDLVESGRAACAFSLYPVSIEELLTVADHGMLMAPKCTWFEPKLRSGLFVHTF